MQKYTRYRKISNFHDLLDCCFRSKRQIVSGMLAVSLLLTSAEMVNAKNDPIELDKSTIHSLRKFYASPVKNLNLILQQASKAFQSLPTYSVKSNKSYILEKFSIPSEPQKIDKIKLVSLDWLLGPEKKYSRFLNDPKYAGNKVRKEVAIKPGIDIIKQVQFDYKNIETSVATLKINNKLLYNFEVISWPDKTVSVPIKALAEMLDVNVTQSHVTNNISYKHPATAEDVTIDSTKNKILVGTKLIEVAEPKLVYLKEGFMVQDDIFVPEYLVGDLLDIKTSFSDLNYDFAVSTGRILKATVEKNENADQSSDFVVEEDPFKKVDNSEKENKFLSLSELRYNITSSMSQSSSGYYNSSNTMAGLGFQAKGKFLGGEYNIGANTYYGPSGLQVGGYRASLDYIRPRYELSLGGTNASLSEIAYPNSGIWGFRFGSVGAVDGMSAVPRIIEGNADNGKIVELFINDVFTDRQPALNGRFEFDSLNYPTESKVKIRVEQIGTDGKREVIYKRKFSQNRNSLAQGQKQFLIFSGIDSTALAPNISLFGDQFDRRYVQPVKFVTGGKFRVGVSDNLTVGVNVARDFLIRQPSRLYLGNINRLSNARTYRTGRSSSGSIVTMDLDYQATKNLHISSEFGFSSAKSIMDPEFDPNGTDFGGFVGFDYNRDNYSLRGKIFSYGPDFYSPGSSGLIDRRGFELSSNWRWNGINFNGNISRYNSNLDNYFLGGLATVSNYSLYASGKIDKYSDLRIGMRSSGAENSIYMDRDYTFDRSRVNLMFLL